MTDPREAGGGRGGPLSAAARDLPASLVVFLVALPLSLGIALASDAPLMAGVIAAAVGGIVVGLAGGAPLQVSGPAAGLTVLVFTTIESFGGDWRAVCAVTVAGGILQVILGGLKVARLALAVSPAVVHGMLAGIGILIFLGQLHVVLGGTPQSSAWKNLGELPRQVADLHGPATALGLVTLAVLVLWPHVPVRALRALPNALPAVVIGTVASLAWDGTVERVNLAADARVRPIVEGHVSEERGAASDAALPAGAPSGATATTAAATATPAPGPDAPASAETRPSPSIAGSIQLPRLPEGIPWTTVLGAVVALALIASVESLLCAVATDKLHSGPRANLDRELLAQGLGNTLSGLLGGLPITGVIVRSAANIAAGATTRASAVLHGVWVLVFVSQLGHVIEWIPKSVLAALLVYVGARLVNPGHVRELHRHGELVVYVVTVAGIVGKDLLLGVGLGLATAVARLLIRLARVRVAVEERGGRYHVLVTGSLSFVGVPRLAAALETVPRGAEVDVDLAVDLIDHAGLDALHVWRLAHERTGGRVDIDELHEAWGANGEAPPGDRSAAARGPALAPAGGAARG
jgi:carbonic anhydrase